MDRLAGASTEHTSNQRRLAQSSGKTRLVIKDNLQPSLALRLEEVLQVVSRLGDLLNESSVWHLLAGGNRELESI